ncbi:MAG: Uma2 family endonuclease [Cyanobacteria bacterium P01_D01_bin.123]
MISISSEPSQVVANAWVEASWNAYMATTQDPKWEAAHFYYDTPLMRVEMAPIGSGHGRDNSIVSNAVNLFATVRNIRAIEFTNSSFRLEGERECQPDIAVYVGEAFEVPPQNNEPIDVLQFGAPHLAIEIAATSLSDDLGRKRLLYEQLGVREYWVVDVNQCEVIAFAMSEKRSGRIRDSRIFPGLNLVVVEEALQRGRREDDMSINRWLLEVFTKGRDA